MIGGKRRVRRSARQRNRSPVLVDDELSLGVAAQDAADEADVVQETGDDEVDVILRLDRVRQRPSSQDVAADHGYEHGVFVRVVERVAPGDAFDRRPGQRAQALGFVVLARAKNLAEVFREKLAKLLRGHGRNHIHFVGSQRGGQPWVSS